MRMLEYFIEKSNEPQGRNLLGGLWQELNYYVLEMEKLFEDQKNGETYRIYKRGCKCRST